MNLGCLVMITGRIARDLDFKMIQSQKGAFATVKFNVAVNRSTYDKNEGQEADFIPCEATGKTAEFINNYFQKGDAIMLVGTLLSYKRKNQDGSYEQYPNGWKVKIEQASFVPGAQTKGKEQTAQTQSKPNVNPFGAAQTNAYAQNVNPFAGTPFPAAANPFAGASDLPFDPSFMGGNPGMNQMAPSQGNFGFGANGQTGAPDFSTTFLDDAMPFN